MSSKKKLIKLSENISNNDEKTCNLKFSNCDDNKCQLWDLTKDELKAFVSFAKKIESTIWSDIQRSKGFQYENVNSLKKPDFISEDVVLKSLRVNQTFRIYGYRSGTDFFIIWFDPNHQLT